MQYVFVRLQVATLPVEKSFSNLEEGNNKFFNLEEESKKFLEFEFVHGCEISFFPIFFGGGIENLKKRCFGTFGVLTIIWGVNLVWRTRFGFRIFFYLREIWIWGVLEFWPDSRDFLFWSLPKSLQVLLHPAYCLGFFFKRHSIWDFLIDLI